MNFDQPRIQELISRLAQSLNVEVKRWIDPTSDNGVANLSCLAL